MKVTMDNWINWAGILSLCILFAGLVLGAGFTGWTVIPLMMIGASAALAGLWAFGRRQLLAEFIGLRSTQSNSNILISIVAVVVILGLINFLGVRYQTTFDLTQGGLFSLSSQTRSVLQTLDQSIKVWVFALEVSPEVRQQLERYERVNPDQFDFEIVNPRRSPELTRRYEVSSNNTLVVESGDRRQQVLQPDPANLESELTPAILKVIETESLPIAFVEGHGEISLDAVPNQPSLSQASAALEQEGFTVETLNLINDEIDEATGAVVIAGPERTFLPGEVDKLIAYLDQGGKLLLLLGPQVDVDLDPLFEAWGIELNDAVVVDQLSQTLFRSGPFVALGANYGGHPITEDLSAQGVATLFPLARSIEVSAPEEVTETVLVSTSQQGVWGETSVDLGGDTSQEVRYDAAEDLPGSLDLAVALSREVTVEAMASDDATEAEDADQSNDETVTEAENADEANGSEDVESSEDTAADTEADPAEADDGPREARFVMIGSSNFVIDGNFNQQGNADLFLNSINWLVEQSDRISIRPKSITNRRLELTQRNLNQIGLLAILGLPLLAIVTGVSIWWQRR